MTMPVREPGQPAGRGVGDPHPSSREPLSCIDAPCPKAGACGVGPVPGAAHAGRDTALALLDNTSLFWRIGKSHGRRKVGTAGTGGERKGEKRNGRKTLALTA